MLSPAASETADNNIIQPQIMDSEPVTTAGQDQTYLDTVVKNRDIIRDYIKTLITDTIVKVTNNINQGKFDQAKSEVQKTQITVNGHEAELGEELFKQYQIQLETLNEHINTQEQMQTSTR